MRYPNIYTSQCADSDELHVQLVDLASDYTGEVLLTPQDIQDAYVARGGNANLHGVELYITQTDLVSVIEQQIASRGN